jgi:hypothetical protein
VLKRLTAEFGMGSGIPASLEAPSILNKIFLNFQKALMIGAVNMKNTIDKTAAAKMADANRKLDL